MISQKKVQHKLTSNCNEDEKYNLDKVVFYIRGSER